MRVRPEPSRSSPARPVGSADRLVRVLDPWVVEAWVVEAEVGVPEGLPVLVGPDLSVDGRLAWFFLTFAPSSLATATSYASTFATFFGFLDRRGRWLDSASGEDVMRSGSGGWRTRGTPGRISAASFNRELAALGRLYRWAAARGMAAANTVRVRKAALGEGRFADVPEGRVRGAKTSDVKWLTSQSGRSVLPSLSAMRRAGQTSLPRFVPLSALLGSSTGSVHVGAVIDVGNVDFGVVEAVDDPIGAPCRPP